MNVLWSCMHPHPFLTTDVVNYLPPLGLLYHAWLCVFSLCVMYSKINISKEESRNHKIWFVPILHGHQAWEDRDKKRRHTFTATLDLSFTCPIHSLPEHDTRSQRWAVCQWHDNLAFRILYNNSWKVNNEICLVVKVPPVLDSTSFAKTA